MGRKKKKKETPEERKKRTVETMKKNRQVDSNYLRDIITGKLEWVQKEIERGKNQIKNIKIQIHRLEGIELFINDMLQPPEKEEEKE